jgi:4-diphosphocytidyl-2C-methyl-D-erythritol kinase
MSGSGATVFGIFADEAAARKAQQSFTADGSRFTAVVPTI